MITAKLIYITYNSCKDWMFDFW